MYIIHILIWGFVMFGGFLSPKYAEIIVYIIVPTIYILHILPFHPIESIKANLVENTEAKSKMYNSYLVFPFIFDTCKVFFTSIGSIFNPLSAQGMLILGMIINTQILRKS
jgi:hypothetical protein